MATGVQGSAASGQKRSASNPVEARALPATDFASQTSSGGVVRRATPDGLYELLVRLRSEYDVPPVYITENGAAFPDERRNGLVDDSQRVSYLERHLDAVSRALAVGVPVEGYFVWSLLDNFEWSLGYSERFGIVYVDFETLERVPKASYAWYRDFIARRSRASRRTRQ